VNDAPPVATYGLTHVAIAVADVNRAFEFYHSVFGMVAVYRDENFLQAQTPGARDVLVFERSENPAVDAGSLAHFGFRLTEPATIHHAATLVANAGGTVEEQGEFVPGEPYLFARDRDGHLLEIWYELPTPVDPS
jgi:catechol 2,3-dioxygenase-like lactoylglutathione lyase family enzyme